MEALTRNIIAVRAFRRAVSMLTQALRFMARFFWPVNERF